MIPSVLFFFYKCSPPRSYSSKTAQNSSVIVLLRVKARVPQRHSRPPQLCPAPSPAPIPPPVCCSQPHLLQPLWPPFFSTNKPQTFVLAVSSAWNAHFLDCRISSFSCLSSLLSCSLLVEASRTAVSTGPALSSSPSPGFNFLYNTCYFPLYYWSLFFLRI